MALYLKNEAEQYNRCESTHFQDIEWLAQTVGRRAIHLHAHLRERGHPQFESFVAAFGPFFHGHPDSFRIAARLLENTVRYKNLRKQVGQTYSVAQKREFWACRAAEAIGSASPVTGAPAQRRGVLAAFGLGSSEPTTVSPSDTRSPILADVADIAPYLESIPDEFDTTAHMGEDKRATAPVNADGMRPVHSPQAATYDSNEGLAWQGNGSKSLV